MNQIKCPKCNTEFELNQASLTDIVRQVRNNEFSKQLEIEIQKALELASVKAEKDKVLLEQRFKSAYEKIENEKQKLEHEKQIVLKEKEFAVKDALANAEKEKTQLLASIHSKDLEARVVLDKLRYEHEIILRHKEEELARAKDNKARLNTKLLGETLEKHCEVSFDRMRATAFQRASFSKDNASVKDSGDNSGTKGDYVFREIDDSGVEIVSIMFEMKNQENETATKKRNEDFLEKLHKDRIKKKCEYAVLVSLLEPDSEYYNDGIVDVSHKYEKMFVVRPQFFIPIISLLRNASMTSIQDRRELQAIKNDQIDLTNFEEQLNIFKDDFGRNYRIASDKFRKAIEEIDKSIKRLEETKAALLGSENQLRIANDKVDDVTIKKLTRNSPETRKKLEDIRQEKGK